jgi:hypothetical protein
MDTARRVDLLEGTLAKQLSWIAAADTKTGFIFGVAAAMLGLLASAAPGYGKWTPLGVALAVVASALLFASLACAVLTIFPRTAGPRLSVIFFGGIASRNIDAFRTDMQSLTDESYEEDLTQQCHINASIASQKYRWVKFASVLLAASVLPWVAAAYMLFRDR